MAVLGGSIRWVQCTNWFFLILKNKTNKNMRQFGLHMKFKTLWLSGAVFRTNLSKFEFLYLPSLRGCKSAQCDLDRLKPKPSYKAPFLLHFEKKFAKTDLLTRSYY